MGLSWPEFTSECKSRLSALARSLYRSRSRLEAKYNEIKIEIEERNLELKSRAPELQERNDLIASQAARIRELEESLANDPPLFQHQFGGRMISLSVNLASKVGLRAAVKVLRIIWDWLGAKSKIPTWQAILFRDFKHYLANQFESLIGKTPRFTEFIQYVTNTRSAVQQTDLAHLAPPSLKPKSRFMNMEPLLSWAMMVLWQLSNLTTKARQGIANEKLESKLSWLREFRVDIKCWWECQ